MFEKKTVDGYEQFPIKNREFTQDFTYSLMIAEIAKSAIRYETDASGKQIKYFDDIGFKICMNYCENASKQIKTEVNKR